MARYEYSNVVRDGWGNIIKGATVSVYLATTVIPASVYTAAAGGTAVNSVTSSTTDGSFSFFVDESDYPYPDTTFKLVLSATGFNTFTIDNINIFPFNTNLLTLAYLPSVATLSALAQLSMAADKNVYATGAHTVATNDFTASARTFEALTAAQGDLLYSFANSTWNKLTKGAANTKLFMNGAGTLPEWANSIKLYHLSRDMQAATGSVSYTAVGFKPSAVIFVSYVSTGPGISIGIDDASVEKFSYGVYGATNTTGFLDGAGNQSIMLIESGSLYQLAYITSMDSQGFTLSWTRVGSTNVGTGYVYFLALR